MSDIWGNMDVAPVNTGYQRNVVFQKKITIENPGESKWILIPDQINCVDVTLSFSGGASGKMQTTTDEIIDIKNDNAVPVDWPFGTVEETFQAGCLPVSGIRAVQEGAGIMIVTVRAQ